MVVEQGGIIHRFDVDAQVTWRALPRLVRTIAESSMPFRETVISSGSKNNAYGASSPSLDKKMTKICGFSSVPRRESVPADCYKTANVLIQR